MTERATVRLGIPALFLTSTVGAIAVSLHTAASEIPGFAFGSHVVLAAQLALLFFYAALLLLLVPVVRALTDGELPIELSLKGARWSESVEVLGDDFSRRLGEVDERLLFAELQAEKEIGELRDLLGETARTESAISDGRNTGV
jgi:hypothetical protein